MMRRPTRTLAALASSALLALTLLPVSSGAATASAQPASHVSCATAGAGQVRCLSQWEAPATTRARSVAPSAAAGPTEGLTPPDIRAAYGLPSTGGAGQTIAIVDAFDNPNAEADLAVYRAAFGLPACTTANGCFTKINQRGGSTPPEADPGWGVEINLDLQAVSAVCPKCRLLLVEADDPSLDNIGIAVNRAVKRGATVVSNSYGTDEFTGIIALGKKYYTHPGVPIVVSSGDFGFTTASFPAVLSSSWAVGGTVLTKKGSAWSERAWDGAGSGCSAWIAKPAWQTDKNCAMRTVSDVSAVAEDFAVYDTFGLGEDNGWITVSGTSISAPLISGMIGLAGNPKAAASPKFAYNHKGGLKDVVGGSNGFCGGDYLCTALKGYDGPTGLGSPRGVSAL